MRGGGGETLRQAAVSARRRPTVASMLARPAGAVPAGALLFETALRHLGAAGAWVSDRGLRWGVLLDRWESLG